jgi:hypothetical protein
MSETKVCNRCNEEKELTEFYSQNFKRKDGSIRVSYQSYCKLCAIEKNGNWNKNNTQNRRNNVKKYNSTKKGKANRKQRHKRYIDKVREWHRNNPDKLKQYGQNHRNHSITQKEWLACKEYFNNSCAYCGIHKDDHFRLHYGEMKNIDLHREHVDHQGANDLSNCIPACMSCNASKGQYNIYEWYNEENDNFFSERLDKIHRWISEDYNNYIDKEIKLEDLLKDCNDDNRHEEIDWGKPEGKEIW